MKRLMLIAVTALMLAGACAPSSPSAISAKAATALSPDIQAVRVAASGHSRSRLRAAINQLKTDVAALQAKGEITNGRAAKIDDAAGALLVDFDAAVPPPSPSPTPTTPSPTPTTPSPSPTVTATVTVTPTITPTTPTTSPGSTTASP